MSRSQQDQFIDDDEEETCPLCVEEFDLTDKGFKPCPCGYQICQFCYNSIKITMNGLCPACRRPYNDKDIEYKAITAEESAAHKARQAQKQKKTAAALQKEKQKAEADHLSRKHLAGLRVVQKNLVYVTGLSPTTQEEQLLATLRGDQYFGQYGDIVKIVVSKAKDPSHPHSVGVYVTYKRKEDAESCIAAVDGSKNGDRTLRAQYGTTKYCSAYLRGEICQNRNCMFLHEPGEASDSYSRADLSALNAGGTQHGSSSRPPPQSQQPMASASQPMIRQPSDHDAGVSLERPALPSHASWASKPMQQPSRAESRATSAAQDSPAVTHASPAVQPATAAEPHEASAPEPPTNEPPAPKQTRARKIRANDPFFTLLKNFSIDDLRFACSLSTLAQADLDIVKNYPPLFDKNGGIERRARRTREEEQRRMEQEAQAFQQPPPVEHEDNPEMSGSLQLGGEPEERQGLSQPASAIQPPSHDPSGMLDQRFQFGGIASPVAGERGLTAQQQHQQMLLQTMKPANGQGGTSPGSSFQQQPSNPPGHQRNASRYSFANDSSASTSVKPVASAKLLNQQSSIMPPSGNSQFAGQQQQHHANQFYTSNVQGPPPGLKATGTPPVSGGMTFGQGHGFATGGLQYGAGAPGRNANEEMMRNLLRGRDSGSVNSSADASKHDADFPPLSRPRLSHPPSRQHSISLLEEDLSRRSTPPVPPGFEAQVANESRRSTPTVPPGLSRPTALPDLDGISTSRPGSRASVRRAASGIVPVTPLRPSTPSRQGTPVPSASQQPERKDVAEIETPTKTSKVASESAEKYAETVVTEPRAVEAASGKPAPVATAGDRDVSETARSATGPSGTEGKDSIVAEEPKEQMVPSETAPSEDQTGSKSKRGKAKSEKSIKAVEQDTRESERRKPPGKLDISSVVHNEDNATTTQAADVPSQGTFSERLDSPSAAASSPTVKTAPRTLRVVPTPKTEAAPTLPSPAPVTPATGTVASRQTSTAIANPPGTPSSEQVSISDNVSVASTSQSRASSPPPAAGGSKTGSAPLRPKTKNQLKKERQELAKVIEEDKSKAAQVETAKAADQTPAQEAIVSRKKKTKKEKEPKPKPKNIQTAATPTADSTPTASRPSTPGPKETGEPLKDTKAGPAPKEAEASPSKVSSPAPKPASAEPSREPTPPPTPTLSASQLLSEIKASAPEIQRCIDSLFRSPASNYFKSQPPISAKELRSALNWKDDVKHSLNKDEVEALLRGRVPAIRYGGSEGRAWDRGMFTPAGAHIRALTEELETRFLELERAVRDLPEELRFRPTKPQNDTRFPTIDLTGLKRQFETVGGRGVSVMEQMIQDGAAMKKGAFLVDEASKYLNEFVMPPATPPPPPPAPIGNQGYPPQGRSSEAVLANPPSNAAPAYPYASSSGFGHAPTIVGNNGMPVTGVVDPVIAERALLESRRVAEERDAALRKIMKKNRKVLGLG